MLRPRSSWQRGRRPLLGSGGPLRALSAERRRGGAQGRDAHGQDERLRAVGLRAGEEGARLDALPGQVAVAHVRPRRAEPQPRGQLLLCARAQPSTLWVRVSSLVLPACPACLVWRSTEVSDPVCACIDSEPTVHSRGGAALVQAGQSGAGSSLSWESGTSPRASSSLRSALQVLLPCCARRASEHAHPGGAQCGAHRRAATRRLWEQAQPAAARGAAEAAPGRPDRRLGGQAGWQRVLQPQPEGHVRALPAGAAALP